MLMAEKVQAIAAVDCFAGATLTHIWQMIYAVCVTAVKLFTNAALHNNIMCTKKDIAGAHCN